jgi:hypothetical protein
MHGGWQRCHFPADPLLILCLVFQVMVIFIVFGGVYVNSENVPRALKWLPNVSLIKHCFEALCVNEFRGLDFETRRRPGEVATGEQVRGLRITISSCPHK